MFIVADLVSLKGYNPILLRWALKIRPHTRGVIKKVSPDMLELKSLVSRSFYLIKGHHVAAFVIPLIYMQHDYALKKRISTF